MQAMTCSGHARRLSTLHSAISDVVCAGMHLKAAAEGVPLSAALRHEWDPREQSTVYYDFRKVLQRHMTPIVSRVTEVSAWGTQWRVV